MMKNNLLNKILCVLCAVGMSVYPDVRATDVLPRATVSLWQNAASSLRTLHAEFLCAPFAACVQKYAQTIMLEPSSSAQLQQRKQALIVAAQKITDAAIQLSVHAKGLQKLFDFYAFKAKCQQVFEHEKDVAVDPENEFFPLLALCTDVLKTQAPAGIMEGEDNLMVRKLELNKGDTLAIHADIHGDAESLIAYLQTLAGPEHGYLDPANPFKIAKAHKNDFYMVFLGDYAGHNRGDYAPEVYTMLCCLYVANPGHVFLLKGNHEEINFLRNSLDLLSFMTLWRGFSEKVIEALPGRLKAFMSLLPSALFVGTRDTYSKDFIICCHAGVEYFGKKAEIESLRSMLKTGKKEDVLLMSRVIDQANPIVKLLKPDVVSQLPGAYSGFLWTDFSVYDDAVYVDSGRGLVANKQLVKKVLDIYSPYGVRVYGYIRGHQHSGDHGKPLMMLMENADSAWPTKDYGVAKLWLADAVAMGKCAAKDDENGNKKGKPHAGVLWDGIVCTLLPSPHAGYGTDSDVSALLKINGLSFDRWRLEMLRIPNAAIDRLVSRK